MQPAQIVNIADDEMLNELERAYAEIVQWVEQIKDARNNGRMVGR